MPFFPNMTAIYPVNVTNEDLISRPQLQFLIPLTWLRYTLRTAETTIAQSNDKQWWNRDILEKA